MTNSYDATSLREHIEHDHYYYDNATWYFRFALFPHKCVITNRWIWFGRHYKLVKTISNWAGTMHNVRWIHKEAAILVKIVMDW